MSLHIRPASMAADDGLRLISYFDSQLSWLETIGSNAQWGSSTRSDNEDVQIKYRAKVEKSETEWNQPWSTEWIRVYFAEVEVAEEDLTAEAREFATQTSNGAFRVPVAAMILAGESMEYVRSILPRQDESHPFLYLAYLLSDRRVRPLGQGAGAALLSHAKDEARSLGIKRICSDCWNGNDQRLVKYYENKGFEVIGTFVNEEKDWPGAVLDMRL